MEVLSRPELTRQDSRGGGSASGGGSSGFDSRFTCNICFDAVVEPVVTQCGHLYCWPCLFRWLEPGMQPEERVALGILRRPMTVDTSRRACPVCKSPCSVPTLVPIYVRSNEPTPVKKRSATSSISINDSSNGDQSLLDNGNVQNGTSTVIASSSVAAAAAATSTTVTETGAIETDGGAASVPVETVSEVDEDVAEEPVSITGLRQRIRSQQQQQQNHHPHHTTTREGQVPSRPAALSPRPAPASPTTPGTPQYRNGSWITPLTPNGHRASLSQGILLSFQQASSSSVPPLHYRRGGGGAGGVGVAVNGSAGFGGGGGGVAGGAYYASELENHSHTAEYLSRLLILLASFVFFCLLIL